MRAAPSCCIRLRSRAGREGKKEKESKGGGGRGERRGENVCVCVSVCDRRTDAYMHACNERARARSHTAPDIAFPNLLGFVVSCQRFRHLLFLYTHAHTHTHTSTHTHQVFKKMFYVFCCMLSSNSFRLASVPSGGRHMSKKGSFYLFNYIY